MLAISPSKVGAYAPADFQLKCPILVIDRVQFMANPEPVIPCHVHARLTIYKRTIEA